MPKLKNAPVFFTAAQVTHNPVLSVDGFVTGLQETFRGIGFSGYQEYMQRRFELVARDAAFQLKTEDTKQHVFSNFNRTACFVVEASRIFYCVTEYDVFEVFRKEFERGLQIVSAALKLEYYERVSMRLLDAVIPNDNNLAVYLVPELLGLPNRISHNGWAALRSGQESTFETSSHQLALRTFIHHGSLALPPDIQVFDLQLPLKFREINSIHAVLDCDAMLQCRNKFNVNEIAGHLRALKDDLGALFEMSVTAKALKEWNNES
jgi:uncharacterized protein (TIGR04255 family)